MNGTLSTDIIEQQNFKMKKCGRKCPEKVNNEWMYLGQYYKKGIGQSDFSSFPFSGPLEKQNGLQTAPGSDKRDAWVNIN